MTSKIKVNNIEDTSGNALVSKCGSTVTLGKSGDTIALASGASQTGFGRTGTVDWETTPKTATFTAVSGKGYFCNTSGGAFTVNLPAGSAGAIISLADYTRTFNTNNLTVSPNGSEKIGGVAQSMALDSIGQSITLIYVDSTEGWINTQNATTSETGQPEFPVVTGGTVTESGNFKIHKFTSPGTLTVTSIGSVSNNNRADYVVVGGGGAGGPCVGGGGGAGGTRFSDGTATGCYTAGPSPLGASHISLTATSFPITVGAGATGAGNPSSVTLAPGSSSIFSTITSAGGGSGGGGSGTSSPIAVHPNGSQGVAGGSGGGGGFRSGQTGGAGNTPPVSPPQGNAGGNATPSGSPTTIDAGGGGGGATAAGSNGADNNGGNGGTGLTSSITASPIGYGGGGGGAACAPTPAGGSKGTATQGGGGGGNGTDTAGTNGTTNTGGGGGGSIGTGQTGNGGSGVVIIRYKFQ